MAFVINVFARRIVGWRVSTSMREDFVLAALEQALYARQPARGRRLITPATAGRSLSRAVSANGWPKLAANPQWAAPATATITLWQRPSTDATKPH